MQRYIERRHREAESDVSRERFEGFMREVPCPVCDGSRLKPVSMAVTLGDQDRGGKNIAEVCALPINECADYLRTVELSARERQIGERVLKEILERLNFLLDVGLDYLSLNRPSGSLSGGEAQRIRLATQIGAGLVGVLYVLDEPSIGLHQRDNQRLIETLVRLKDLGNTLIVVEHDEDTIRHADWVVDIGPGAGEHGGQVVHSGSVQGLLDHRDSMTGQYLSGRREIPVPAVRRPRTPGRELTVKGAKANNLRDIDVTFPLGLFISVTGVSGSGKSTLVNDILYTSLAKRIYNARAVPGRHQTITGLDHVDKVIHVDQSPIGRTPRSNPATYTGVFDHIRKLFASTPEAKMRGYQQGRFSFNVKGGRCEACSGDGTIKIEMNFLPDVYVPCEVCHGARYNRETLEVHYKGKTIAEILDMPIEEAVDFFAAIPAIARHMKTLVEVGLGYVRLGQPATTLSGGEAQRVKLSSELQKRSTGRTVYVLDEPTTGLHFEDIRKLLLVLGRLVDQGNSVLVIEHNLDVIKTSDWIVDMGPEGGSRGGTVIAEGTPEDIAASPDSYTGQFLKPLLDGREAKQPKTARRAPASNGRRQGAREEGGAPRGPPRRPPPRRRPASRPDPSLLIVGCESAVSPVLVPPDSGVGGPRPYGRERTAPTTASDEGTSSAMTDRQPQLRRRTFAGVATVGLGLPVLAACSGDDGGDRRDRPATPPAARPPPESTSESASESPSRVASEPADAFAQTSDIEVGGGTIYPDEQIVITQPSQGEFKCFTAVCTHQGCIVSGVADGNINCACHGSAFSIADGSVVNGPATQPLAEESITVQGDSITLG